MGQKERDSVRDTIIRIRSGALPIAKLVGSSNRGVGEGLQSLVQDNNLARRRNKGGKGWGGNAAMAD